jgi:hypothetical protein
MSHTIHTDDINRWFLVYDNKPGESGFVLFGYVGPININELSSGQPNIASFLTEDELEIYVDNIAGADYYKNAVESGSDKFQGPSIKYPNE